ncbi:MAG: methionyl-tRNA formyltransferase [Candidatus Spechtbacterales bacterium]
MHTVFFGTPDFAAIILKKLIDSPYRPFLVVTAPDKPAGRGNQLTPPPVKVFAQETGIEVVQPEKLNAAFVEELKKAGCELAIVAAYGLIIPQAVLDVPQRGFINVHGSLLPKYRGASPIQQAILDGEKETGPTIMLMDAQIDHGPILSQRTFPIAPTDTAEDVFAKMAESGGELLLETIPQWTGGDIVPREQDHKTATYTERLAREDGHINWSKPADHIERMLRAYTPWPGIFVFFESSLSRKASPNTHPSAHDLSAVPVDAQRAGKQTAQVDARVESLAGGSKRHGKRLKILALATKGDEAYEEPGKVIAYEKGFAIQTKKGLVVPTLVHLENKRPQSAEEFLRAYPDILTVTLQ